MCKAPTLSLIPNPSASVRTHKRQVGFLLQPSGPTGGSENEEEERDEWEAASDFEGFFEDVQGQEVPGGGSGGGGGLVISLGDNAGACFLFMIYS